MTVVYALLVLRGTAECISNAVYHRVDNDAPECELFPRRRELAQFVPHHILRDEDGNVVFPVMDEEPQTTVRLMSAEY